MALRDRPYLPLYIQDYLTDEKLIECSAESQGVYIRLMCLMHKSEEYGTILLKQKDKQTCKQILDFALKLARQMPFGVETIERALTELLDEKVIAIEDDLLYQKRMVRDGKLSDTRAYAGRKSGKNKESDDFATANANTFATDFAIAKTQANAEYENEYETEDDKEINVSGELKENDTKKREVRHKHGEYGWVRLTQREYDRLLLELGEAELRRCIDYVDDSAQGNGNKNKWRDWNVVIRRCHKNGWGRTDKNHAGPPGAKGLYTVNGVETSNPFLALMEEMGHDDTG